MKYFFYAAAFVTIFVNTVTSALAQSSTTSQNDLTETTQRLSTSEFAKCRTSPNANLSNTEIRTLVRSGLLFSENWSDDPADGIISFFFNGPNVRDRQFPYFRVCGAHMNEIARTAFEDPLNNNYRLTRHAPATLAYWIENHHFASLATNLLEQDNEGNIRYAQALLRLAGAGGLKLTGKLDRPTVIALALRKQRETFVPDTVYSSSGQYSKNAIRNKARDGQMILPSSFSPEDLSEFLENRENHDKYRQLAELHNLKLDARIGALFEKIGEDSAVLSELTTSSTIAEFAAPPNQVELTNTLKAWFLEDNCNRTTVNTRSLLFSDNPVLAALGAVAFDTIQPDRGLCLVGSKSLGVAWHFGIKSVSNLNCTGSDEPFTCTFFVQRICEASGIGTQKRKDAECAFLTSSRIAGKVTVSKAQQEWQILAAQFRRAQ